MFTVDPSVVILVAALFGLGLGSFVNVLVIRTHQQASPWFGRSRCVSCGHHIAWYDNIPLISFAALRGRCRHCQRTLSWQYPLVEATTATLFSLVAWQLGLTWWTIWAWAIVTVMVAIAVYDARWSLLPDNFSIALAIIGVGWPLFAGVTWIDVLLGGVIGVGFFGAQYLVSRGRWVGSGDIVLAGALGLLLGWRMLGLALLLAYFIGSLVAAIMLATRRQQASGAMAFGPYLVAGAFLAWLWGEQIIDWYFSHALFR